MHAPFHPVVQKRSVQASFSLSQPDCASIVHGPFSPFHLVVQKGVSKSDSANLICFCWSFTSLHPVVQCANMVHGPNSPFSKPGLLSCWSASAGRSQPSSAPTRSPRSPDCPCSQTCDWNYEQGWEWMRKVENKAKSLPVVLVVKPVGSFLPSSQHHTITWHITLTCWK